MATELAKKKRILRNAELPRSTAKTTIRDWPFLSIPIFLGTLTRAMLVIFGLFLPLDKAYIFRRTYTYMSLDLLKKKKKTLLLELKFILSLDIT